MFYLAPKYLKIRMVSRRFPGRLWRKRRNFTKCWGRFVPKVPFNTHSATEILKISSQFWLIYFVLDWCKIQTFSNTRISVSVKTFLLKLKTVSEQKYPTKRPSFVTLTLQLLKEWFELLGC